VLASVVEPRNVKAPEIQMRCFITGATGFIGSAISEVLLDRGYTVIGLTSSEEKITRLEQRGIQPVFGSMFSPDKWSTAAITADVIIHAAAIPTPVRPGKRYLNRLLTAQEKTVQSLLEAAKSVQAFIYTSGMTVYGYGKDMRTEEFLIDPVELAKPYVLGERLVLEAYHKEGLPCTILRPAGVYGAGGVFGKYWTQPMLRNKRAPYPGNGNQVKSFISVTDCAKGYVQAVEHPMPGHAINLADDQPVAFNQLIPLLAEELGSPKPYGIPALLFRLLAGQILAEMLLTDMRISNQKMKNQLGVELEYPTYREGIPVLAQKLKKKPNPPEVNKYAPGQNSRTH